MINVTVVNTDGEHQILDVPTDIGLNLMEVLKAYEYDIMATCGGMGLCATCHVEILSGGEKLHPCSDNELDTLDTLPDADVNSRLACQIRPKEDMVGLTLKLRALEEV
jgi:ferredoxin